MVRTRPITLWQFRMIAIGVAFLLVLVFGCGSRRSEVDKKKSTHKDKVEQVDESSKTSESTDKSKEESTKVNDKVNEKTETTTTTKYDTSGKPLETTTTTKTSKTVDKSKTNKKKLVESKLRTIEKLKTIRIHTKEKIDWSKIKKTDANNSMWGWVVGVALVVLILAYFAYRYFTKPKIK